MPLRERRCLLTDGVLYPRISGGHCRWDTTQSLHPQTCLSKGQKGETIYWTLWGSLILHSVSSCPTMSNRLFRPSVPLIGRSGDANFGLYPTGNGPHLSLDIGLHRSKGSASPVEA